MSLFKSRAAGSVVCIWPDRSKEGADAVNSFAAGVRKMGYRFDDAVSTPQGIELIARSKPDLVFVHNDPSTMATLTGDINFARHYRVMPDLALPQAVLFRRSE